MKSLLPIETQVTVDPAPARVLDLADDQSDAIFATLSSSTSRQILSLLYEDPRPARDLAEATDTTLQNVRYHLDKLSTVDLVHVADTWYSAKGNEMQVYAPTDAALVLCSGHQRTTDRLKSVVSRFIGAVAALAGTSAVVQHLAVQSTQEQPLQEVAIASEPVEPTVEPLIGWALLSEPGVLFFVGGLVALCLGVLLLSR